MLWLQLPLALILLGEKSSKRGLAKQWSFVYRIFTGSGQALDIIIMNHSNGNYKQVVVDVRIVAITISQCFTKGHM